MESVHPFGPLGSRPEGKLSFYSFNSSQPLA
jgi:hypothetical protein